MRRWNGWGDSGASYPLPPNGQQFLAERIGPGTPPVDADWGSVAAAVPPSRLPAHPLISQKADDRLRHARGQSLPDWIALRSGQIPAFPDGVALPENDEAVAQIIQFARETGVKLIPYGGGTSVVGHINPEPGGQPVLTVSLARLNQLRRFDETSHLATFGAGARGPDLEAQLRARGFTLGHFPQSFELSTLGGWVVTRSAGQQSLGYGRIEELFAGGKLIAPAGTLHLPPFPASAAGPDIREMVLGSEGRLGILTEAVVRVSPLPEQEEFHTVFFPDFESGMTAARHIIQAKIPLSMMRLSTAVETETTLALAGHERLLAAMGRYLRLRGVGEGRCLFLFGVTGTAAMVKAARKAALALAAAQGGVHVGQAFGKQWQKNRFRSPYLRNTLWAMGYAVDTVETAAPWSAIPNLMSEMEAALREPLTAVGEQAHIFTHLSHVYPTGASIYTTVIFRLAADWDETLNRWRGMKTAVCQAIVQNGGTISHQHGVGKDHAPFLAVEKGELGMAAIEGVVRVFDAEGIMNCKL